MQQHTESLRDIDGSTVRTITPDHVDDSATPLVLINGLGAGVHNWGRLPQFLDCRIIAIDPTTSRHMPVFGVVTMEKYGEVIRRVIDKTTSSKVHIGALSWGGLAVEEVVIQDTDRFDRVVLAATGAGGPPITFNPTTWWGMISANRSASHLLKMGGKLYGGDLRDNPGLMIDAGIAREVNPYTYSQQLSAALTCWTNQDKLPRIKNPTLILAGEGDPISPVIFSKLLHNKIPNSELHIEPDGGHLFLLTRPEKMAGIMNKFLTRELTVQPV